MIQNGYKVFWLAYSGLDYQIGDTTLDKSEARKEAASVIRSRRRAGFTVSKIGDDRWEIQKREQGGMVSDTEGYLILREPRTFPCRECGFDHAPDEYLRAAYYQPICDGCANPESQEDEEAIATW